MSGEAVPGAGDAVHALRADGHRLRFVTNNTTRSRERLADELRGLGVELDTDELTTTPFAAAGLLAGKRVLALTMEAVRDDLAARVELVDEDAQVVLLGGADESDETGRVFSYDNLNRAFAELERGARLVCLHKNRWWQTSRGSLLDSGAFVAGLEYAAGVEAEVVGKPTRAYFDAALAELGAAPDESVMVGDDIEADIGGAKAAGLRAVLVRTGKFREAALASARTQPGRRHRLDCRPSAAARPLARTQNERVWAKPALGRHDANCASLPDAVRKSGLASRTDRGSPRGGAAGRVLRSLHVLRAQKRRSENAAQDREGARDRAWRSRACSGACPGRSRRRSRSFLLAGPARPSRAL